MPDAIPRSASLKGGNRVANFGLATTERWTDREGKPAEATEWHRIVVYGAAVDIVEQRLRKGDPVMVEGRIATRLVPATATARSAASPRSSSPGRRAW